MRETDLAKWFEVVTNHAISTGADFSAVYIAEAKRQINDAATLVTEIPGAPFRDVPRKGPGGGSGQSDSS